MVISSTSSGSYFYWSSGIMNGMLLSLEHSVPLMRNEEVDDVASCITIDEQLSLNVG